MQAAKKILALLCTLTLVMLVPFAMAQAEAKTVEPLPATLTLDALDNCTFEASFHPSDVYLDEDGALVVHLTVCDFELFDAVELTQLVPGDTIVIAKESVVVDTIEWGDRSVDINGGLYKDGYTLWTNEDGVYSEVQENDAYNYYAVGEATLPVGQDFVMTDSSDLEQPERTLFAGDFLTEMAAAAEDPDSYLDFSAYDTVVTVTDGFITKISHYYAP